MKDLILKIQEKNNCFSELEHLKHFFGSFPTLEAPDKTVADFKELQGTELYH